MKRLISLLVLMSLCMATQAQNVPSNTRIVIVRFIHDGQLTYSYNLQGIRDHMEYLATRKEKAETYQALLPILKKMEKKKKTANVTSIVLGTAAVSLLGFGGYKAIKASDVPTQGAWGGVAAGGMILGVAAVWPQALYPHTIENDILRYVNTYNSMNPDSPLQVY